MTVSELDYRMSSRELTEWMVYAQIEPFGPPRQDYHASLISTVIANSNGNKMKPEDFIKPFEYEKQEVVQEDPDKFSSKQEQMMAIFRAMAGAKNGKENDRDNRSWRDRSAGNCKRRNV